MYIAATARSCSHLDEAFRSRDPRRLARPNDSDEVAAARSLPIPISTPLTSPWHEADKDYAVQCEYQLWRMSRRVSPAGIGKYVCPEEDLLRRAFSAQSPSDFEPIEDAHFNRDAIPSLVFGMED